MDHTVKNYHPVEAGSTVRTMWIIILLVSLSIIIYWPLHFFGYAPASMLESPGGFIRSNIALDTLFILTGLSGYRSWRKHKPSWLPATIASLSFSLATGLVSTSWFLGTDNWIELLLSGLFVVYPLLFLRHLARDWRKQATKGH